MKDIEFHYIETEKDIDYLYNCFIAGDQFLYSTKLMFKTMQEFKCWLNGRLHEEFHDFYIVRDGISGASLGYVYNYDFTLTAGHCKLVVYITENFRKVGIGGIVTIKYMKMLFEKYPLRKIYSTIYDYNKESLKSNLSAGFEEEGCLNGYRYYDEVYHKLHYLSMSREKFKNTLEGLVE